WAVNERNGEMVKRKSGEVYEPTVSVSTKKLENKVEIRVSDNGSGIPDDIKDKIFQPFFTTKPSGQGTGLGLSLAYDIIKAHGGSITINTYYREPGTLKMDTVTAKENSELTGVTSKMTGSTFIIQLPI
ncbi:MAG: HAMP domain-containing sensor histidine kinase, partial [Saprospiraceae bacterium]